MSYLFTADDLDFMREVQDGHMQDTCVVLSFAAGSQNEFGEYDAPTYTAGSAIDCGLEMQPGFERDGSEMTLIEYDAVLRLPIDTTVKETDRIKVTDRYAENTDDLTYWIVAPIQRGPSGIRLRLKKLVV